jgi:hypothetical protein
MLYLILAVAGCNQVGESKTPASAPAPHPDNEMSVAFREQGRRAFDAIERVPSIGSTENPTAGFELRALDAEKAVDEAKYKASTAKDKTVLDLLGAALYGRTGPEKRSLLDPDHLKLFKMGLQCETELRAEFEPENLSELGRQTARQKSCLTQQKAILDEFEQKRLKSYK